MTTADSSTRLDAQSATLSTGTLQPFPGRYIPGVCFESGHCVWLLDFISTPTRFDSYVELWLVTPDGERVLYTDPGAAADEVMMYHDFDRTEVASITHDIAQSGRVKVSMEAADGTSLETRVSLGQTLGTRVLNMVIALTPQSILRSRPGTTVSTALLNLLVDANGLKVAGQTETGRAYRLDAERIRLIQDAVATLDGTDLGALQPPQQPIEFGDAKTTGDALYVSGTLHLERGDA